ncbi:hypothetical protein [Absidia glauca]|uniref:Yeast cell wall synthesis Kre9/Knh1-like N-terminal domain-containing protein n=1 Tax=Absidia glauca TaxID=4829 RepID=A0A168P3Z5_ABSGL|nr:hypothetical protein [Absidia glauca]
MTSVMFYGILLMATLVMMVKANMSPSNPEPGTVWTSGKEYEITWGKVREEEEDNTEPAMNASWKNFRIDLMTGEDMDQVVLTNIAENVNSDAMKYKYTVPEVAPHAPIYFLMFTSEDGEFAWSTRFAIVGQDGKQETPENSSQPSGEKIPWGVGKLVSGSTPSTSEDDEIVAESLASASSAPSVRASAESHPLSSSAAMPSASLSNSVHASPSAISSVRKGDASVSVSKPMSDATSQHLASFTIVGAFVSSVVGLFLF